MNNADTRVRSVSVLIRSMDRPTLPRALDSASNQVLKPTEIVVVAACGDRHGPLPRQWNGVPLRLVTPAGRLDRSAAANAALDAATGDWLNFLDDDDELLPDHWLRLAEALDSRPSCRLAYSITAIIKKDGTDGGAIGWPHHRLRLLDFPQLHMMAALFHRSLSEEGVRFDESLPIFEDHDFLIQCACRTEFAFVDHVTNRWFGYDGTSGAGLGGNNNAPLVQETLARIRRKWATVRHEWSGTVDGLLHLGLSAAQEGRAAEASSLLDRAVDRARDHVDALSVEQSILLGKHALKSGRAADALALLESGLEKAPNDVNALNLGGMANFHAGHLRRAEDLLLRALEKAPGHPGIRENVRLVQARLGEGA